VFVEESYDALLEQKQWDHTVELIPEALIKNCKVYPLFLMEQMALDKFISLQDKFDLQSPLWPLHAFSLRKRMEVYVLFKTTGL